MSFARFRKPTTPSSSSSTTTRPLQERQGNITSLPPTHPRPYKPSHIINDEEAIPLTRLIPTRQKSFTMKTLNPRRLSLRLKNRPQPHSAPSSSSTSPSYTSTEHKQRHIESPAPASVGGRTDFVYKPVRRADYTAVVAETQQAHSQSYSPNQRPVSRYQYNYIPTGQSRRPVMGDHPAPQSRSRSRARAHYDEESERYVRDRDSDPYDDLDEQPTYSRDAERARALASLQARPGREYGTTTVGAGAETYTSAAEKRRSRAAKRLTTVMVPDVDEIYDW